MILINVKFKVRPEYVETFRDEAAEFTNATRAEPGCLFYEWYRSTDRPDEYVLVEGFQDDAAEVHVNSEHFKRMYLLVTDYGFFRKFKFFMSFLNTYTKKSFSCLWYSIISTIYNFISYFIS